MDKEGGRDQIGVELEFIDNLWPAKGPFGGWDGQRGRERPNWR